jgi:CDGSH-type Zn-finger protein
VTEQTKITALDNGPYLVKGPVVVTDAEGNEFRVERETIALCRCGGSTTKPFCDGAHSKAGFRAAERAVREEGEQGG